ncbi:amidohydrolase family protein [Tropicimonas sp.]|uniref:amidohydrolase family protein n=1 Tax=Tropicimonas sp. TaxID=2067044 RepID=UPI003A8C85F5
MDYIDTHLHLIARDRFTYGWADAVPVLAEGSFLLSDAQRQTGGRVAGWIFMETAVDDVHYPAEARWIRSLMDREPRLLGQIASCRPETDRGFDAWIEEADDLNIVGYRRILHVVDDALSQSETFRANLHRIGAAGRVFDMCFLARQLPVALELALACPDVSLVLDHCGVPDIAGGGLDPWRADMTALASLPNVTCKLSGIMAYCTPGQANEAALRPFFDHVLGVFGPKRMLWGSDWPVVNMADGLPDWLDMTDTLLSGLSPAEAAEIASGTAARVYGVRAPERDRR